MLERDIVASIKKYLSSLGSDVFFWKEHGGPYGCAGIPDVICCYKGRFIGLECKLPGGRLTAAERGRIEAAGSEPRGRRLRIAAHRVERCDCGRA